MTKEAKEEFKGLVLEKLREIAKIYKTFDPDGSHLDIVMRIDKGYIDISGDPEDKKAYFFLYVLKDEGLLKLASMKAETPLLKE